MLWLVTLRSLYLTDLSTFQTNFRQFNVTFLKETKPKKILSGICPEDRVLFIGTSRTPWDAEQKLLFQCYAKVIQIPRADYGSISLMWRTKLHKAGALSPRLELSCLSRVSDSYTIGKLLFTLLK